MGAAPVTVADREGVAVETQNHEEETEAAVEKGAEEIPTLPKGRRRWRRKFTSSRNRRSEIGGNPAGAPRAIHGGDEANLAIPRCQGGGGGVV